MISLTHGARTRLLEQKLSQSSLADVSDETRPDSSSRMSLLALLARQVDPVIAWTPVQGHGLSLQAAHAVTTRASRDKISASFQRELASGANPDFATRTRPPLSS